MPRPNVETKTRHLRPRLRLGGESLREPAHVALKFALGPQELDVGTIDLNLTSLALLGILFTAKGGETPVLGDDNLLATREPVLGCRQYFETKILGRNVEVPYLY